MNGNPRSKNTRSKDFRYVYANGIGMQFGDNDVTLVFGVKEDPTDIEEKMMEEVAIFLTPSTAKALSMSLAAIIEQAEKSGGKIPIDQSKMDNLLKVIAESEVKKND